MEDNIIHEAIETLNLFERTDSLIGEFLNKDNKNGSSEEATSNTLSSSSSSATTVEDGRDIEQRMGLILEEKLKHDLLVEITKERQHEHIQLTPSSPEEKEHDAHLFINDFEGKVQRLFDDIVNCIEDDNHQHHYIDNQKTITPEKMRLFMKKSKILVVDGTVDEIMKLHDTSKDGHLSFDEFKQYMIAQELQLRKLFNQIDLDKSGDIGIGELKAICKKLKLRLSDKEMKQIMKMIDKNKSNSISYEEWYDFMHRKKLIPIHKDVSLASAFNILKNECEEDKEHPKWKYFLAGGMAAAVARTAVAPLERLRCLYQIQTQITKHKNGQFLEFQSIREGLREIGKDGYRGLFKGNGMNVMKAIPEIAARSYFYEMFKRWIIYYNDHVPDAVSIGMHQRFCASALAAMAAQALIYPLDSIKMHLMTRENVNIRGIFRDSLKADGWRQFYRGCTPAMIRVGIDTALYESFKKIHYTYYSSQDINHDYPSMPAVFMMATAACTVNQVLTYPLQLVRTRLQMQNVLERSNITDIHYTGMSDAFKQIWKTEGIRGLYRGSVVTFLKSVPTVSTTLFAFEFAKREFGIYSQV